MKRVLVTGAGGQLGRALAALAPRYPDLEFVLKDSAAMDITDAEVVQAELETGYDYCINAAAYTAVDAAEEEPDRAFAVNATGVRHLAEACKANDTVLIHISTDYVFDGTKQSPYLPTDTPNPINVYGKSKLAGERAIQEVLDTYMIVRTSWLYSEKGKNFYTAILKKARAGEPLSVTDQQTGCPTHVNNLAAYLIGLLGTSQYGILHFTDGEAMTWYDFARRILRDNQLLDKVKIARVANYRTFAARPAYSVLK